MFLTDFDIWYYFDIIILRNNNKNNEQFLKKKTLNNNNNNNNNNVIDFIFDVKISVPKQSIQWQMKQREIKAK